MLNESRARGRSTTGGALLQKRVALRALSNRAVLASPLCLFLFLCTRHQSSRGFDSAVKKESRIVIIEILYVYWEKQTAVRPWLSCSK